MLRKVNDKNYTFAGNKIASFLTQNVRFAVANIHPDLLFGFSIKDEKTTFWGSIQVERFDSFGMEILDRNRRCD